MMHALTVVERFERCSRSRSVAIVAALLVTACDGDRFERLPGGFVFEQESRSSGVIVRDPYVPGSAFVPCDVERYVFDQRFILARQIAGAPCWPEALGDDIASVTPGTSFWVIDLKRGVVQGPIDRTAIDSWAGTNSAQALLERLDG